MPPSVLDEYQGRDLVLIVGCQRSGTTWLQRLLSSHSKISTGQESYLFKHYIHAIVSRWKKEMQTVSEKGRREGLSAYFTNEEFQKILKEYLILLMKPMLEEIQEGRIFLEKTPEHSFYMNEIHELLPEAKFIHIIRDGRDVVASLLATSKTWAKDSWGNIDARSAARLWMQNLEFVKASKTQIPRDQFCELKYEDLRSHTVQKLEEIRSFLNLDWTEQEIIEVVQKNSIESPWRERTKIPLRGEHALQIRKSGGSPARPDRPSSWKEDLTIPQKISVWLIARRTLVDYGYEWRYPWRK